MPVKVAAIGKESSEGCDFDQHCQGKGTSSGESIYSARCATRIFDNIER